MINNPLRKVGNILRVMRSVFTGLPNGNISPFDQAASGTTSAVQERRELYELLWYYYNNTIFNRNKDGGGLDYVNDLMGEMKATDMAGLFNPVKRLVEVYAQNIFAGRFGRDVQIADEVGTGDDRRAVHPSLKEYVNQIAKWTNFNVELKKFVRYGAIFGTVGIRIVAKVGAQWPDDDPEERRVYLQFEHPGMIVDAEVDDRDNVKSIITQYNETVGQLTIDEIGSRQTFVVTELMNEDYFERRRGMELMGFAFGNQAQPNLYEKLPNVLGVCPYVIAQHSKLETIWGEWVFSGTEQPINIINALKSHLNRQIWRHVRATWAVASAGAPPVAQDLSGNSIIWFELDEGTAPPMIQAMVSGLSLTEAAGIIKDHIDEVADRHPELRMTDQRFLSGVSGETFQQYRLPAEANIKSARTHYEDTLIRAIKIGLSWGIMQGIFDFGTGVGSQEAAQAAYAAGYLDFEFNERPALSITDAERLNNELLQQEVEAAAGANTALGFDKASQPTAPNALSAPPGPSGPESEIPSTDVVQ